MLTNSKIKNYQIDKKHIKSMNNSLFIKKDKKTKKWALKNLYS